MTDRYILIINKKRKESEVNMKDQKFRQELENIMEESLKRNNEYVENPLWKEAYIKLASAIHHLTLMIDRSVERE